MPWKKSSNTAQYKLASWDNFVSRKPNCSPEEARRIALHNPAITFYFFCREGMVLEGHVEQEYGPFSAGEAVFFSGSPTLGSAPQCDTYEKCGLTVAYLSPNAADPVADFNRLGCHTTADGSPAIDIAVLFAANYCTNDAPYLRAQNNNPVTQEPFNANLKAVLESGAIKALQDKGVVVLLSILNGQSQVGWSEFTDESTAQGFVEYLKQEVVVPFGLDGIDIDDEYSQGTPDDCSLAMVTTLLRQSMSDKLLTKALFDDTQYLGKAWKGKTFTDNLHYGWEMSYFIDTGADPVDARLSAYAAAGMSKAQLCLGFSGTSQFASSLPLVPGLMRQVVSDGYGGGMVFGYENQPEADKVASDIVDVLLGPGNFNKTC